MLHSFLLNFQSQDDTGKLVNKYMRTLVRGGAAGAGGWDTRGARRTPPPGAYMAWALPKHLDLLGAAVRRHLRTRARHLSLRLVNTRIFRGAMCCDLAPPPHTPPPAPASDCQPRVQGAQHMPG